MICRTQEVAKLIFPKAGEESVVLSTAYTETSTYMWCNSRDYILSLHGEAHDNKIIMTKEDHAILREDPCAKLEEKEKQEKIRQLKTRDPKDMPVILLQGVILQMGISFKSSGTKTKLVEKVVEAWTIALSAAAARRC